MATGDVRGNLERLKSQLRSISYPHALDTQGLMDGLPAAILPLIHYAFLGYSRHVARYLSVNGYVLYAKSDLRFVECVIKLLRKEFEYRCPLTVAQIFARGFAEKKFIFVHDLIQMCKRKHNDLLRIVRNSQKKPREYQQKAFGRVLHHSQRRPIIRNKHMSSKFDRRCELDLLPDAKCREICRQTACQEDSWIIPEEGKSPLTGVVDSSEEHVRASLERTKEHGLRVLTRSKAHNDERCHVNHTGSRPNPKFTPIRTAIMGAQMIHREHGYGSLSPDPDLQERDHDLEETSPIPSPGIIDPKQGNISGDDCPSVCPTTSTPEEDSNTRRCKDITKSEFTKDCNFKSASIPSHNHNVESLEGTVTSNNAESQTPTMQENICPHNHLHGYQLSAPEDVGLTNIPTHKTADDLPPAVWQKIMDLSGKVDSCFYSLDSKIAHSFNSLDEKLEMKFKYLDEGVTCTRETLQDKLNVLENRIVQLERTTQISPMSFQSQITYNDDNHPIREITNTFNNGVDSRSCESLLAGYSQICS